MILSYEQFRASRKESDDLWSEVAHLREDYEEQNEMFSNRGFVYDIMPEDDPDNWTKICITVYNDKYYAYDYNDRGLSEYATLEEAEYQTYYFQRSEADGEEWKGD